MLSDWLAAEQLLIARLQSEVGSWVKEILGARELSRIDEGGQVTPALHVIYDGEVPSASSGGHGAARVVTQTWLVVIAVESAADIHNGAGERITVGQLMARVIAALAGHKLNDADFCRPIERQAAPRPAFNPPWAYWPTAFNVQFSAA